MLALCPLAQGVARHLCRYRTIKRNWLPQLECSGYSVTDYILECRYQVWSRRDQNLSPLVEISTFAWLNSIPVCQKQHSCIRTKFLEGWQIKVRGPRSLRRGSWTEFRGKASRLAPPWTPNRGLLGLFARSRSIWFEGWDVCLRCLRPNPKTVVDGQRQWQEKR